MHAGMKFWIAATSCTALAFSIASLAQQTSKPAQDKYSLSVPGGLAFSEFKGYENWQLISISQNGPLVAAILGNPAMIDAFRAGVPGNGKPFPDGAKMAKIHWTPGPSATFPRRERAARRSTTSISWSGQQAFRRQRGLGLRRVRARCRGEHVPARHEGRHAAAGQRRQMRIRVHTLVQNRDFVFTEYATR